MNLQNSLFFKTQSHTIFSLQMQLVHILIVLLICSIAIALCDVQTMSLKKDSNGHWYYSFIETSEYVALGKFSNEVQKNGWGVLDIQTSEGFSDLDQLYAAGFLEGFLTQSMVWDYYHNFIAHTFPHGVPEKVFDFLQKQWAFMINLCSTAPNVDDIYYNELCKTNQQFQGFVDGYNRATVDQKLSLIDLFLITSEGDLYEIVPAVNTSERIDLNECNDEGDKCHTLLRERSSCTAFIRLGIDGELFFGHNTWSYYASNLRVKKQFRLNLKNGLFETAYTSKPGYLYSKDDFYVVKSTQMAVSETTNSVFDSSLYSYVVPESVPTWARVMIAMRASTNGSEWVRLFSLHNSGTYNSQWMVLDFKQFRNNSQTNVLWIVEATPGKCFSADVSDVFFRKKQWASYNIPYLTDTYNRLGYPAAAKKFGDAMRYDDCPRAWMFKVFSYKEFTLDYFMIVMRYNKYQTDPYSIGDPANALCSRYDLRTKHASAFGCLDAKITSNKLIEEGDGIIQCGPTHDDQKPFSWSDSKFYKEKHDGMPNTYDFGWVFLKQRL
eukprot:TRINITY_DN3088_c1_g1_i1.p1 TRINITY_DN3088_c1_g1~~TRINITY_DN3088_c1_g1_i1.p1  ORF type:complete len:551 (+),score=134.84 TRINITY_DN3088_c1_g1_i1:125-1777(+)